MSSPPPIPSTPASRVYRYFDLLMAAFVTVLLCSELIGPGKSCSFSLFGKHVIFGAGNIFFPISYIFGDVLTEVYGYAKSRRVIWAGFGAIGFAAIMSAVIIALPLNPKEPYSTALQPALELVYGNTWRVVVASMLGFWVGDFVNSYVLAKMKVMTAGRMLWTRTIGSTIAGQFADSVIFYPLAFGSVWSTDTIVSTVITNWLFKVGVEALCTPLTYGAVNFLKRAEGEDFYDRATNFTPFSLKG